MSTKSMTVSDFNDPLPYYRADDRPANLTLTPKGLKACTATRGNRLYNLTAEAIQELNAPLPLDSLPHVDIKREA